MANESSVQLPAVGQGTNGSVKPDVATRLIGGQQYQRMLMGLDDGPSKDAFGRLRVSEQATIFAIDMQYGLEPSYWQSALVGGGTVVHVPNESSARMTVTSSGDKVTRQTWQYYRYQPGKSHLIEMTGVFGAAATNIRRRVGYFDDQNGIYIEQTSTGVRIVRRTFTSGSIVNNAVEQASWNADTFSGAGGAANPSGYTLDLTKGFIIAIDLQWLGYGRVRIAFVIDGSIIPVHAFLNSNVLTTVYMTTATLPLRYELEATGVPGGAATMTQTCTHVASEGGYDLDLGRRYTASNRITQRAANPGPTSLVTVRPKLLFNGLTNRKSIFVDAIELLANSNVAGFWELVFGGTIATPVFTDVATESSAEFDVAGAAVTGGDVVAAGYVLGAANGGDEHLDVVVRRPLSLNIAGNLAQQMTLRVTSLGAALNAFGCITFREVG